MFILCQTATNGHVTIRVNIIIADVYFVSNRNYKVTEFVREKNYSRCLFCVKPQLSDMIIGFKKDYSRCLFCVKPQLGTFASNYGADYSRCLFCVKPQHKEKLYLHWNHYSRCLFCVKPQHKEKLYLHWNHYSRCLFCILCRTRTRAERIKIASILHAVEIKPRGVRRRSAGFAVFGVQGVDDIPFCPYPFADQL